MDTPVFQSGKDDAVTAAPWGARGLEGRASPPPAGSARRPEEGPRLGASRDTRGGMWAGGPQGVAEGLRLATGQLAESCHRLSDHQWETAWEGATVWGGICGDSRGPGGECWGGRCVGEPCMVWWV